MDKYSQLNFQGLTDEMNKRKIAIAPEMTDSEKGRALMRKALREADAKKARKSSSKAPAGKGKNGKGKTGKDEKSFGRQVLDFLTKKI